MKKIIIGLLTFAFVSSTTQSALSQPQHTGLPCGTVDAPPRILEFIEGLDFSVSNTENGTIINIPVTLHLTRTTNGAGGFNEIAAYQTICNLNQQMAPAGLFFYVPGPVRFINNDDFYAATDFDDLFIMIDQNHVPRTANIYYCDLSLLGLCGFAFFPDVGPSGPIDNGAIVMSFACSQPTGATLAHEVGHYLALPHTFEGTSQGPTDFFAERVTRNFNDPAVFYDANCNTAGDRFCDTPADFIDSRWTCPTNLVQLDINNQLFEPDPSLFMSYSRDNCMNRFSQQQITTMRAVVADSNADRGYLVRTPMPAYVDINFAPTPLLPLPGDTVIPNFATFRWNSVLTASMYQLKVYVASFAVLDTFLTDTSYTSMTNKIRANRNLTWEVRALNGASLCTPFSSPLSFRTSSFIQNVSVASLTASNIKMYPNRLQSGELLQIEGLTVGKASTFYLYDTQGRLMLEQSFSGASETEQVQMPFLSAGMYMVTLKNANQVKRDRLYLVSP